MALGSFEPDGQPESDACDSCVDDWNLSLGRPPDEPLWRFGLHPSSSRPDPPPLFFLCLQVARVSYFFFFFFWLPRSLARFPPPTNRRMEKRGEPVSGRATRAPRFLLKYFFLSLSLSLSLCALCVRGSLFSVWQERKEEDRLIVHRLLPRLSCVEAFFSPFFISLLYFAGGLLSHPLRHLEQRELPDAHRPTFDRGTNQSQSAAITEAIFDDFSW